MVAALVAWVALLTSFAGSPMFWPVWPPPGTHPPVLNPNRCRCGADLTPADWEEWDRYKKERGLDQYAPKGGEHATDAESGERDAPIVRPPNIRPIGLDRPLPLPREGALPAVPAPAAKGVSDAATIPESHAMDRQPQGAVGVRARSLDEQPARRREGGSLLRMSTAAISATPSIGDPPIQGAEIVIVSKVTATFTRTDDWGLTRPWAACLQWDKVDGNDPAPTQTFCSPVQPAGAPRHVEVEALVPATVGVEVYQREGVARGFTAFEFDATNAKAWVLGITKKFVLTDGKIEEVK